MTFKEPLWSTKFDPNDKSFYDTQHDHYQEKEDTWVSDFLGSENDVIADIIDSVVNIIYNCIAVKFGCKGPDKVFR